MRLWSIHPKYLDLKGLVAVWREGLLAKKVLEGKTERYKNHPQLIRFKNTRDPVIAINTYIYFILEEALGRGYTFDKSKLYNRLSKEKIPLTKGQLIYEFNWLRVKLQRRDPLKHRKLLSVQKIECHPIFELIEGEIEEWEKIKT